MATQIEQVINDIRTFCAQKQLAVFPGRVISTDAVCYWETENHSDDWRLFVELGEKCGSKLFHLSANDFDYDPEQIEELAQKIALDDVLPQSLVRKAQKSINKPYQLELAFLHDNILYKYIAKDDELSDLAELLDQDNELTDEDIVRQRFQQANEARENVRQEVDNIVKEILQDQAYLNLRKTSERETFALSLVKEKGKENHIGYSVARLAEKEYQQRFKPNFFTKIADELALLRDKDPKVSKAKAQAVLGISKADLEAVWYKGH